MAAVLPIRATPPVDTLESLTELWICEKNAEDKANERRVAIEQRLLALRPERDEGSETLKLSSGMKLTITHKLKYSADLDHLMLLAQRLPEPMRPVKTEHKLDETGAKWLRNNEPEMWATIAPAIEIKPMKPSFRVSL